MLVTLGALIDIIQDGAHQGWDHGLSLSALTCGSWAPCLQWLLNGTAGAMLGTVNGGRHVLSRRDLFICSGCVLQLKAYVSIDVSQKPPTATAPQQ